MNNDKQSFLKRLYRYRFTGWKESLGLRLLLFAVLFVIVYASLAGHLLKPTYDIVLGSQIEKTIPAPEQVKDELATARAQEAAANSVEQVFAIISMKNDGLVEQIFAEIDRINEDDQITFDDKVKIYRELLNSLFSQHKTKIIQALEEEGVYDEKLFEEMTSKLTEQFYRFPEEAFFKLPRLTKEDLQTMKPVAQDIVRKLMNEPLLDAEAGRAKVAELVNSSSLTKKGNRELVQEIARFTITANKFSDQKATELAKNEERQKTKPVYIAKGEPLVVKGQVVTEEIYEQLKELGMLKEDVDYWPQVGLFTLVFLLLYLLYMFLRESSMVHRGNNPQILMLILIFTLNIIAMKIVSFGQSLDPLAGYIAPVAMGTMLITLLLDEKIAVVSSILFSLLASIILNAKPEVIFDYRYAFVAIVIGFTTIFSIKRASQRSTILKAGVMISISSAVALLSLIFLGGNISASEIMFSLIYAVAGGILTAVLVIGLMPFFEVTFGILSSLKLVELSNPNHPLLRKLLTETPGTYHHSVMVGNLSEAAAEAIGANGLLCRVGSYYHDIGKTRRPNYFIENQVPNENPHDKIEPELSKSIIIAHARDGVEMLAEHKMPKQIRDIAEQHHGTTLLTYFYFKAKKLKEERSEEMDILEQDYRYPGPKAQSKEAAIVGIADCVEAAVRSLRNPTIEQIDSMIQKIIKSRLDDGQFNECDLTLKELDQIGKTLNESLLGIFHSRIEYPENLSDKKQENESENVSAKEGNEQ